MPSWSSTELWRAPRRRVGWNAADEWSRSFKAMVSTAGRRLDTCLRAWDCALDDIGGDPSREDWEKFRPLRLSREEDWSDWLAHLLESSLTGRFPARLLARDVGCAEEWRVTTATREQRAERYRADLVVRFRDGGWVHVEIKIGDLDLAKTPDTTEALRRVVGGGFRGDYLLLPAAHVGYWGEEKKRLEGRADNINTLTWVDVVKALRDSVIDRAESLRWRVWAATFLGSIEQRLLGYQRVGVDDIVLESYRPRGVDVERVRLLEELLRRNHEHG
jgi:hypothetical protein